MIQIRVATLADLDAIMQIIEQARLSLHEVGTDQWQYGYPNKAVLAADIHGLQCFVAESDGVIAGLAVLKPGPEKAYEYITGPGWLLDSAKPYLVVHRLAVATNNRQRGIASQLVRFAEAMAEQENRSSVRIDTHRGNQPMQRFLEKNGYVYCGLVDLGAGPGDSIRLAYEKLIVHDSVHSHGLVD